MSPVIGNGARKSEAIRKPPTPVLSGWRKHEGIVARGHRQRADRPGPESLHPRRARKPTRRTHHQTQSQLFLKAKSGLEILCQRLFEMRSQWVELVEYADLAEEDKWAIFCLMLVREDARLEEVPGLGLKVTLPATPRH